MSIEQPITNTHSQQIALETCTDPDIPRSQIDALQEHDVTVYKGRLLVGGAEVQVNLLLPSDTEDDSPIGIVNGYCGSEGAYKRLAVETALRGHNVFHIKPPRNQQLRHALRPDHIRDVLKIQSQAIGAATKYALREVGCDTASLYGHSMGGPIAVSAALRHPEYFDSVLIVGGAGVDGNHRLLHRIGRIPTVFRYDIAQALPDLHAENGMALAIDTGYHVFRRLDRTLREGITVARRDVRPDIAALRTAGVKVGLMQPELDGFFSLADVRAANDNQDFDDFQVIPNVRHIYPQQDPQEHSYDIHYMLDNLRSQRAKIIDAA